MSIKALDWAFDQDVFPSSHKLVLLVMANFANVKGYSYPAVSTVCQMTSQHEETVRKALATLVTDGLIKDSGKKIGRTGQIKVYQTPECTWERPRKTAVFEKEDESFGEDPGKTPERPRKNGEGTLNPEPGTQPTNSGGSVQELFRPPQTAPIANSNGHLDGTQKRLAALFRRRDSTTWSDKEKKAYSVLGGINDADLKLVERYYAMSWPNGKDYRRRDLLTLLNNFNGEVDRARNANPRANSCC